MIYNNISELVGKTPLFEPINLTNKLSLSARILCKLEYKNPAGRAKDRVALSMILDAEKKGLLKEGSVIIEPTSGNTGIGLAAIAASKGYRVILTMPESMSIERRKLLAMYGAEVVLTPAADGMQGAIKKAEELKTQIDGSFIPAQFDNPANPYAHKIGTADSKDHSCNNVVWADRKADTRVNRISVNGHDLVFVVDCSMNFRKSFVCNSRLFIQDDVKNTIHFL